MKKKSKSQAARTSRAENKDATGRGSSRTATGKRSRAAQKRGTDLFNQVVKLTGIPAKNIREELKRILDRKGIDVKDLTLDQLRLVVASYLREIMGGLLDRSSGRGIKSPETNH